VTEVARDGRPLAAKSRGETADLNNLATFSLAPKRKYRVHATLNHAFAEQEVELTAEPEQLVTLVLAERPAADSEKCLAPATASLGGPEPLIKAAQAAEK
jgi:hypothetical protein